MFKNKNKKESNDSSAPIATSGSTNSLVAGTNVEGTIYANNDIRIDGSLKGTLDCKGRVIIGPEGRVEGDIVCQNAVIEGSFSGKIVVSELLNIRENANIQGDVETGKLLVQPGAVYNVKSVMSGQTIQAFE